MMNKIMHASMALIFLFVSVMSVAQTPKIDVTLQQMKLLGQGTYTYFWMSIYEARLWSKQEVFSFEQPFALSLTYHRDLKGEAIAKRSIKEMREQGLKNEPLLAQWSANLQTVFPDVKSGDTLTGLYLPGQGTHFYLGNESVGMIQGDEFGLHFFGIWLSENTSAPELRESLLKGI